MGLFDDYFDPDQFQDSGGLLGRLLSLRPDLDPSQSGNGADSQSPFDGSALAAQQTSLQPAVSQLSPNAASIPPAAVAPTSDPMWNLAASGNSPMPSAGASASSIAPLGSDIGAHLNAGFQRWAQTPVGSPFAALANGITGFNTGQTSVAPAALSATPAQAQAPDSSNRSSSVVQNPPNASIANANPIVPTRRPPRLRRWPQ